MPRELHSEHIERLAFKPVGWTNAVRDRRRLFGRSRFQAQPPLLLHGMKQVLELEAIGPLRRVDHCEIHESTESGSKNGINESREYLGIDSNELDTVGGIAALQAGQR